MFEMEEMEDTPPSRHGSTSPMPLTPRTKVAAYLQTFSDSEEDELYGAPRKRASPTRSSKPSGVKVTRDEEVDVGKGSQTASSNVHQGQEGTYERMKREVMSVVNNVSKELQDGSVSGKKMGLAEIVGVMGSRAGSLEIRRSASPEFHASDQPRRRSASPELRLRTSPSPDPPVDLHVSHEPILPDVPSPGNRSPDSSSDLFVGSRRAPRGSLRSDRHSNDMSAGSASPPADENQAPPSPSSSQNTFSGSDMPADPETQSRLQALVAKKRAERRKEEKMRLKEREGRQRKLQSMQQRKASSPLDSESESDRDGETGRRLTQQARPTRKASKKALEEMNRETQRLSRNQQLTYVAKTKKKFAKQDLFAKFKYRQAAAEKNTPADMPADDNHAAATFSSATASSDVEMGNEHDTPPTSPASRDDSHLKARNEQETQRLPFEPRGAAETPEGRIEEDFPTMSDIIAQGPQDALQNKTRQSLPPKSPALISTPKSVSNMAAVVVRPALHARAHTSDSDDELEIVSAERPSRIAAFDKVPLTKIQESRALFKLRMLAHLKSPGKASKEFTGPSLTSGALNESLCVKARKQARLERLQKIEELKAKGILIQTQEEKDKEILETEDLVEKARQEAIELSKREKRASGKSADGADDDNKQRDSDDDEDKDWEVNQLSGSEDGDDADVEEVDDEEDQEEEDEADSQTGGDDGKGSQFLDDQAREDTEAENPPEQSMDEEDIGGMYQPISKDTGTRHRRVIEDDEDDPENTYTRENKEPIPEMPKETASQSQDDMALFGFDTNAPGPLGLTQVFMGTMADQEHKLEDEGNTSILPYPAQDSMEIMHGLPMGDALDVDQALAELSQNYLVKDSQTEEATQTDVKRQESSFQQEVDLTCSPFLADSQGEVTATQVSDMPDPTQDFGLGLFAPERSMSLLPASTNDTVDTVLVPIPESPVVKKRGRLQRRNEAKVILSNQNDDSKVATPDSEDDLESHTNAFSLMNEAAARKAKAKSFDKSKSYAKDIVEEQAVESEDEWAGVGGASDDESDGHVDEEVQEMIDDTKIEIDEQKLAAHYADQERLQDEKDIKKLFGDVANGGLRRKRHADFDLSDSEDDAAERRRRRQRENARMRRALLEDENLGKIAENPKKLAFLRAVEDRDQDDDFMDLDEGADSTPAVFDSQTTSDSPATEQTVSVEDPTKSHDVPENRGKFNGTRSLSHLRRTEDNDSKKPANVSEIREAVNSLLEEPESIPESLLPSSDDDSDEDMSSRSRIADAENNGSNDSPAANETIINRLSTNRSSTTETNDNTKYAFHAPSRSTPAGFRTPSLLRRATSNLSAATSASGSSRASSASTSSTSAGYGTGVRRGGNMKSNIHYQAREAERRKIMKSLEERKLERMKKMVKGQRSVLGVLGKAGGFE